MLRNLKIKSESIENENSIANKVGAEYRMIDWIKAFSTVIGAIILLPLAWIFANVIFHSPFISMIILSLLILLVPITAIVQFKGYLFDVARDALSYPVYVYRRTIPISEIRNANCQTISGRSTSDPGRIIGESRPITSHYKYYLVNVSGDFGVRPITFGAKYKRDQFLSILRMVAPQCRITRWS